MRCRRKYKLNKYRNTLDAHINDNLTSHSNFGVVMDQAFSDVKTLNWILNGAHKTRSDFLESHQNSKRKRIFVWMNVMCRSRRETSKRRRIILIITFYSVLFRSVYRSHLRARLCGATTCRAQNRSMRCASRRQNEERMETERRHVMWTFSACSTFKRRHYNVISNKHDKHRRRNVAFVHKRMKDMESGRFIVRNSFYGKNERRKVDFVHFEIMLEFQGVF